MCSFRPQYEAPIFRLVTYAAVHVLDWLQAKGVPVTYPDKSAVAERGMGPLLRTQIH
jgi:hypothetical protein